MLYEEGFTQNREISWLRYNERVLEEALDKTVPLLERLRFISIFTSNLEDFFKVRVGSLLGEDDEGNDDIDERSGLTAAEQLRLIHSMVPGLLMKKDMIYGSVEGELGRAGVVRLEPEHMEDEDRGRCFDFFRDEIKDRLRITLLSADDELPVLDEERPYMIAALDAELQDRFGIIDIPEGLPQILVLSRGKKPGTSIRYVLTEDIIKMFADLLFIPFIPLEVYTIDIARSAEAAGSTSNSAGAMREVVRKRKTAPADKLITDGRMGGSLMAYLTDRLGIDSRQVFTTTRIDFSYLDDLESCIPPRLLGKLRYPPHTPHNQLNDLDGEIFDVIRRRDILSAYPYDSMDVILGLLREAAFNQAVREIRITIYRLASTPKIADYLIYAARSGKKVRVVLELRARFDEENNLAWADKLRAAGCKVYYGTEKYKVHSKMCQIVLRDKGGRDRYITQISTGNYNEKTAGLYTDLSIATYDQKLGKAASRLFKDICRERLGELPQEEAADRYAPLLASPVSMRSELMRLIRREAGKGERGRIFIKVNSLSDEEIIEALMEASCKGCRIRLIVRGICCILPGVKDCTENICTVNLVGRYLEHSRVYIFGEDFDEVMYISSADIMNRNLDRRVEIALPVRDAGIQKRIRRIMQLTYCDTVKGRVMLPDGSYAVKKGAEPLDSQKILSVR